MAISIKAYRPEDAAIVESGDKLYLVNVEDGTADEIDENRAQNIMARGGWTEPGSEEELISRIKDILFDED